MKKIIPAILLVASLIGIGFAACVKKVDNTYNANGSAPVLTSSATAITPPTNDSTSTVLTLTWTNPKYSTDSANQQFIVELDSTGKNFVGESTIVIAGPRTYSFNGNHLDSIMAAFGYNGGKPYSIDIRVTSSYGNNNEQYRSNVVTVTVTPYTVPITLTPSSTSPLLLQIGNASNNAISFNWTASPYGSDTINYALQLDTVGGNFASPQTIDYGTSLTSTLTVDALNSAAIAAGVIGGSTKNVEFRIVSYIGSTYTNQAVVSNVVVIGLTSYTAAPKYLYLVGDATANGWTNPVATPAQQFTPINAVSFGIIINLTAGGGYVFLPVNGSWTNKYGGATDGTATSGGTLLANNAVPSSNTPAPASSGLYEIIVNFQTNSYTVTPYTGSPVPSTLFIVGAATAGGWTVPVPTPSQQFTQVTNAEFQLTIPLSSGNSYLLLPVNTGSYATKYGGSADGTAAGGTPLLLDNAVPGSNTPAPANTGSYLIDVNFITNTLTVTPS
jgi:starch-binding outer membrane protein SusE/F